MSNIQDENSSIDGSHDSYDRAMRERYLHAAQHVSSSTRARLGADRHAAARGDRLPVRGWPMGVVFGGLAAAVFTVTFGLNFNAGELLDEGPAGAGDMIATVDNAPGITALDHDPDFYAWLASPDAQLMAME
ncbi:MAG: hypothetical protein M3Q13_07145 [Pseudomonadota bacterium]|nr:hypothetical protein [Pseudomonadota bacterium]